MIYSIIKHLFSNTKSIIMVIVVIIAGCICYQAHSLYKDYQSAKKEAVATKQINIQLNGEIEKAKKINDDNSKILKQVQLEKQLAMTGLMNYQKNVDKSRVRLDEVRKTINNDRQTIIGSCDNSLILDTIDSIQQIRDNKDSK